MLRLAWIEVAWRWWRRRLVVQTLQLGVGTEGKALQRSLVHGWGNRGTQAMDQSHGDSRRVRACHLHGASPGDRRLQSCCGRPLCLSPSSVEGVTGVPFAVGNMTLLLALKTKGLSECNALISKRTLGRSQGKAGLSLELEGEKRRRESGHP